MFTRKLGITAGSMRYGTMENDRPQGDYAKCTGCSHEKALHTETGCFMGDCAKFDMPGENRNSNKALENGERTQPEYQCPICSKEFYTNELFTAHKRIKHGDESSSDRKNDMIPGYDYATMTTECQKCGHRASQIFMDGQCACSCHTGMQNTMCAICRKEEGAGLEEHLISKHGMELQDAAVVARDIEMYNAENAAGRLVVEGGAGKEIAFVDCQTCDEGISESKIDEHLKDGHTVVKVMKAK